MCLKEVKEPRWKENLKNPSDMVAEPCVVAEPFPSLGGRNQASPTLGCGAFSAVKTGMVLTSVK